MAVFQQYSWIIAIISIAFCFSSFGNGANDVANSYATSVAARTLTMPQVGILSMITEFVGAVGLGSRVTGTIKNGILDISHFERVPATLILTMGCAEVGSATWLMLATSWGFPVSTTQTVVGAIIGAGIASQARVKWEWDSGSVSQIAASWGIAPMIAAAFSAIIFGTVKYSVLERQDPFKWAMRLIPLYLAFTASILALFLVVETPTVDSLEEFGAGQAVGIILGVFAGMLVIAYAFFLPYFHRRLVRQDTRIRSYHIPLGPLLWRENPPIYFPAKDGTIVKDYSGATPEVLGKRDPAGPDGENDPEKGPPALTEPSFKIVQLPPEARDAYLVPTEHLSLYHPKRLWAFLKYGFWRGVMKYYNRIEHLEKTHARATIYDNKVEHLWTYAQVASAMMMSISHGSNDVANAVGPWVAAYNTYQSGEVTSKSDTPVWILVVAGFLLGAGFWFFGYHIIRSLGNKITRVSPTRGFSIELGAAITVLMASRLSLPVSTTQCLTGATMGVALMNYDLGAVNWRQLVFIFVGWVLTLPAAGLISGLLMAMALNTPHF
ncbi:phosphate-repressible phosphate permease [Zopfia rhizophila CBS 207.26]|uniref:Phosphate transporter n=1 Tax=Zopfia rhizophila CBS 207.26 TaxID=1314779 RepID=A0A6A6D984_9PEZI|nr:phosphate-repressible phosphate permease [Zopfia rhizophila CBS 207.26]